MTDERPQRSDRPEVHPARRFAVSDTFSDASPPRKRRAALALDVPFGCPLSPSQYGAIRMLSLGLTYQQIALAAGCSESTVRSHLHNAYGVLGTADRAQAVLLCARNGWLGEDVEFGEVTKADPLRGFAREYLDALDTHLTDPDDREGNRALAVAAEGLGLGRAERSRETRNEFIDNVIDGLIGRSGPRGRPVKRQPSRASAALAEVAPPTDPANLGRRKARVSPDLVDYDKIARLEAELLDGEETLT